jgi:hypothetical protein
MMHQQYPNNNMMQPNMPNQFHGGNGPVRAQHQNMNQAPRQGNGGYNPQYDGQQ